MGIRDRATGFDFLYTFKVTATHVDVGPNAAKVATPSGYHTKTLSITIGFIVAFLNQILKFQQDSATAGSKEIRPLA